MPFRTSVLEESFQLISSREEQFAHAFYGNLFFRHPEMVPYFEGLNMEAQQRRFLATLKLALHSLRRLDVLIPILEDLGEQHVGSGVNEDHYQAVGSALIETLEEFTGDGWTGEMEHAWREAYDAIKDTMVRGAVKARAS